MAKKKKKKTKKIKKKVLKKGIAAWNGKNFTISPKKILGVKDASIQESYTSSGDDKGRDQATFSFNVTLIAGVGYTIESEISDWRARIGKLDHLYIGEKKIINQKVRLIKVSTGAIQFNHKGKMLYAELALDFEEYRKEKKKKTTSQATSSSGSSGGGIAAASGKFAWPVPGHKRISSQYGPRICPFHGRETHSGIDIPAPRGKSVIAAQAGKVILAGRNGSYGNAVIIDHGNKLYTLYGHNSSLLVKKGQNVSKKQKIAKIGSTGSSTGNHLHFEVRKGANKHSSHTNPKKYL